MPWACAQTHGGMERRAVENLERQSYRVILPTIRLPDPRRFGATVVRPLFPCYVFVLLEMDQWWGSVNGTRGVVRLLTTGTASSPGRPLFLPDAEVEKWRGQREKEYELPPGTVVRVRDGLNPFHGLEGVVEEMTPAQRVRVLLTLFCRPTSVVFESPDALERIVA